MWQAPCDFPTFASIAANWFAKFVPCGRPQRPPIVNRVICQNTWPVVHWLHWSMPVATMIIGATVSLLDFVSNEAVALRSGMNRMLSYFHLRQRQLQQKKSEKKEKIRNEIWLMTEQSISMSFTCCYEKIIHFWNVQSGHWSRVRWQRSNQASGMHVEY